jgi:hypothetical protein
MKKLTTINTLVIALVLLVIMLVATHIAQYMAYKEGLAEAQNQDFPKTSEELMKSYMVPGTGTEGKYIGCYGDKGDRAMTNTSRNLYLTKEDCRQLAIANNYTYYATQNKMNNVGKKVGWCTGSNNLEDAKKYGQVISDETGKWTKCTEEDNIGWMGGGMSNAIYSVYDIAPEYKSDEYKKLAEKEKQRLRDALIKGAWADRDSHLAEERIKWQANDINIKISKYATEAEKYYKEALSSSNGVQSVANSVQQTFDQATNEITKLNNDYKYTDDAPGASFHLIAITEYSKASELDKISKQYVHELRTYVDTAQKYSTLAKSIFDEVHKAIMSSIGAKVGSAEAAKKLAESKVKPAADAAITTRVASENAEVAEKTAVKSLYKIVDVSKTVIDNIKKVREAKRKAEEEARRKAEEEARRKAEEEARRKTEEERLKAEAEAARAKAEEAAKRKAEAEAARAKAEAEAARAKAAEEAKRQAEAEAARAKAAEDAARAKAAEEASRAKAAEEAERQAAEEVARAKTAEDAARAKAAEEAARAKAAEEAARAKAAEEAKRQAEAEAARAKAAEDAARVKAAEDAARAKAAEESARAKGADVDEYKGSYIDDDSYFGIDAALRINTPGSSSYSADLTPYSSPGSLSYSTDPTPYSSPGAVSTGSPITTSYETPTSYGTYSVHHHYGNVAYHGYPNRTNNIVVTHELSDNAKKQVTKTMNFLEFIVKRSQNQ